MTAGESLSRIVQLVAELSRDPAASEQGVVLADLAERLGTTPDRIQRDIRTLTSISDDAEAEWLQSLTVWQEGDRVTAVSRGPYRRPIRFTPDELLAIRIGLALEGEPGNSLAARFWSELGATAHGEVPIGIAEPGYSEARVVALAREAIEARRVLRLLYAGERDSRGVDRQVEPHEVVAARGHWYIVAWCRRAGDWRHFRADRVLETQLESEIFARREGHQLGSDDVVFRTMDVPDEVVVRFSPVVARWLAERHPGARVLPDGSLEVTLRVVEPAWLVRTVLQYGDEAEVIGPPEYRRAMESALHTDPERS